MLDDVRYPLAGDATYRTLAVGVLFGSLGVLVLPAVFVAGYYGRVLAAASVGRTEPPRFDDLGALFVQGLKTWAVVALYLLASLLLLLSLGAGALFLGGFDTGAGSFLAALAIVLAVVVLLGLLMIPTWFFFPAALVHVARTDSIAAAFDVRTIAGVATDRQYLRAWAGGVAVLLLGSIGYLVTGGAWGALAGLLLPGAPASGATIAGHVVGVAINFYCQVVAFHRFGRGYGAAVGTVGDPASNEDPSDESAPEQDAWGSEARAWRERRRRERGEQSR